MDRSDGWDAVAHAFAAARSGVGGETVRRWAEGLPAGACVLDVGCGSGAPIGEALLDAGVTLFGVDASPTLIAMFRRRFPAACAACEPAQESRFFDRTFDGVVAIGLLFLLTEDDQGEVIRRIAAALKPGAPLLFSAPRQACGWTDLLTERPSRSLGLDAYGRLLDRVGLRLAATELDDRGNHYVHAFREA